MSRINWKDNRLPKLEGEKTTATDGTESHAEPNDHDFNIWTNSVKKKMAAHAITWMLTMASSLVYTGGDFEPICGASFPDRYKTKRYKKRVVHMADKAGIDDLPHPVDPISEPHLMANYKHITMSIASFSAQLDEVAKTYHPDVFSSEDPDDSQPSFDPLAGLKEWIQIQRAYHTKSTLDAGQAWASLMSTLHWAKQPSAQNILEWTQEINKQYLTLLRAGVKQPEADTAIVTSVIKNLRTAARNASGNPSPDHLIWTSRATALDNANREEAYTWKSLRAVLDQYAIDDKWDRDGDNPTADKRRKVSTPAGIAMYSFAMLQQAYAAGFGQSNSN